MDETQKDRDTFDNFIADFQIRYAEQLDACRLAAATTATPAWQANFETQTKAHREIVRRETNAIIGIAERLKTAEPTEDDEKAIKDSVKAIQEERIRFDSWMLRAVEPYRNPVRTAAAIREQCTRAAMEQTRISPLTSSKLIEQTQREMAKWPVAKWDDNLGCVTVEERMAGEQSKAA